MSLHAAVVDEEEEGKKNYFLILSLTLFSLFFWGYLYIELKRHIKEENRNSISWWYWIAHDKIHKIVVVDDGGWCWLLWWNKENEFAWSLWTLTYLFPSISLAAAYLPRVESILLILSLFLCGGKHFFGDSIMRLLCVYTLKLITALLRLIVALISSPLTRNQQLLEDENI